MLRRLSVGLLASALAIAPLPTKAQDGTAEDLGDVMSVSLKDVVKPQVGFKGRTARYWHSQSSRRRRLTSSLCWRQQCLVS